MGVKVIVILSCNLTDHVFVAFHYCCSYGLWQLIQKKNHLPNLQGTPLKTASSPQVRASSIY